MFVGGGVRSGKSRFALQSALRLGGRRYFVATAQALDDEMRERIAAHVRERGDAFVTREAPFDLAGVLRELTGADVVVVDCLTLWLSNLLLRGDDVQSMLAQVRDLGDLLRERRWHSVLVSNEVGMGVVPESALGRAFRDVCGLAHQHLAGLSDEVYFGVLGSILRLRPAPVCSVTAEVS